MIWGYHEAKCDHEAGLVPQGLMHMVSRGNTERPFKGSFKDMAVSLHG